MLFQLGAVTVDVRPFNVDEVKRNGAADYADKDLLGRRKGSEFVGVGTETLELSGKILPFRKRGDGRPALEAMWGQMRAGKPIFVMRGDGTVLDWMRIDSVEETHSSIVPRSGGIGGEIAHTIKLTRVDPPGSDSVLSHLDQMLTLFG